MLSIRSIPIVQAVHRSFGVFSVISWLTGLMLSACPVLADELITKDGSKLVGEVIKREDSTLEFKTSYAGVIKVKWSEVVELHAEKPMQLMLRDERIVETRHIRNKEASLFLDPDMEPDVSVPSLAQSEVEFINPEPWRTGEGYKFTGRINFAFERERGNTDEDELDMDGDLLWRRRRDRFTLSGELEYDKNNSEKTKDKWKLQGVYNHFLTKQWFWGGASRLEHDQFADLDLRTLVAPIVGYQWFESKQMNLRTTTGLAYVNEDFINESDDSYVALPWAIDFDRFLFGEFIQFYHWQFGIWNLENRADVVWDTRTGLRFPLIYGLVASAEFKAEYDSGSAEDVDDLDTTYSFKLGYQW